MQVAVEDAVQHGALEEADHAGAHDLLGVDAGRPHAGHVGEVEAVDPLHDEHAAGDERGVGPRDDERALPELGEDVGDAQHVVGLEAEVELLEDGLGEELDQGGRVGQGGHGNAADEVGRHPGHHGQVLAHPAGHRGALHLDDDRGAVAQGGRVDLGDGGGGQRGVLDRGEDLVERAPQLLAQDPLDDRPGLGRDLVAAPLELGHQRGREDAVTGGDDLAQLDVGRAELLEGGAQAARQAGHRGLAAPAAVGDGPEGEGAAEVAHGGADAGAGRQGARAHEVGDGGAERSPEDGLVAAPRRGARGRPPRARRR